MALIDPPRVVFGDESTLVATWRNVAFVVFGRTPMSVSSAESQVRACEAHGRTVGKGKLVEVVILDPNVPIADAQVRAVLDSGVPRVGPYYACVATIFEGTGFRASVIRGILTSLQMLSRTPFAQKVFSQEQECLAWVSRFAFPEKPGGESDRELAEALAEVRKIALEARILVAA